MPEPEQEGVIVPRSIYRQPVTLENGMAGMLVFSVNLMSGNTPVQFVPDDPEALPVEPETR